MNYLMYAEYETLTGNAIEEVDFNKLLPKSTAILNNVTNHFYVSNDILKDNPWRVNQFKLALCSQIEYFKGLGATTFEGINSTPQTFSAGRTSVSNSSRYNPSGANESKPLISEDALMFLEGTGLLYAGVVTW